MKTFINQSFYIQEPIIKSVMDKDKTLNFTYSISLLFDPSSSYVLENIVSRISLAASNFYRITKGTPSHITIGMYKSINREKDEQLFIKKIEDTISHFQSFSLNIESFEIFREKMIFSKVIKEDVKNLNQALYDVLKDEYKAGGNNLYVPTLFYPHITFATSLSKKEMGLAMDECKKIELPIPLKCNRISVAVTKPYKVFYEKGI